MAKKQGEQAPSAVHVTPLSGASHRDLMGPTMVDQAVRQAIMQCWMTLPDGQRTPENVEKQLTRLVKRAIEDMKEDASAFGFTE